MVTNFVWTFPLIFLQFPCPLSKPMFSFSQLTSIDFVCAFFSTSGLQIMDHLSLPVGSFHRHEATLRFCLPPGCMGGELASAVASKLDTLL